MFFSQYTSTKEGQKSWKGRNFTELRKGLKSWLNVNWVRFQRKLIFRTVSENITLAGALIPTKKLICFSLPFQMKPKIILLASLVTSLSKQMIERLKRGRSW